MTEFQKEIGVIIVLLAFSFGFFVYAETVHIERAGGSLTVDNQGSVQNANQSSKGFSDCVRL